MSVPASCGKGRRPWTAALGIRVSVNRCYLPQLSARISRSTTSTLPSALRSQSASKPGSPVLLGPGIHQVQQIDHVHVAVLVDVADLEGSP